MARRNGRIETASPSGKNSRFYLQWQLVSQSVANNTSTIRWQAGLSVTGGDLWFTNAVRIDSGHVDGRAITPITRSNITSRGDHQFRSGTITISHNADGRKSFSARINGWLYSYGNRSRSGSWTLPTIPRATQPSMPTSFNVGTSVTISLPRASSSFTHRVSYSFNGQNGTISNNAGSSVVWAVPTSLANRRPNHISGTGTVTVQTYNGNTHIGTRTVNFTAWIPDTSNFRPVITGHTLEEANPEVAAHFTRFVMNKSRLRLTVHGHGAFGSTIRMVQFYLWYLLVNPTRAFERWSRNGEWQDGQATMEADTLNVEAIWTFFAELTDSRGRKVDMAADVTPAVVEYYADPYAWIVVGRADSEGNWDEDGSYARVHPGALIVPVGQNAADGENTAEFKIKYKKRSDTTWVEIPITPTGAHPLWGEYQLDPYDDAILLEGIDVDSPYDVVLEATDYFTTTTYAATIPTAFTILDFHADGRGMSFGKVADKTNRWEVGPKLPMHIVTDTIAEADGGFIRMRRADDSLLSYIATGEGGEGLNIHMYDRATNAWSGRLPISKEGLIPSQNVDFTTPGGQGHWVELGRTNLTGTSQTVNITQKRLMKVLLIGHSSATGIGQYRLRANSASFTGTVVNQGISYTAGEFTGANHFWNGGIIRNKPMQVEANIATGSYRPSFYTTSGNSEALRFSSSQMTTNQTITSITAFTDGAAVFSSGEMIILGMD